MNSPLTDLFVSLIFISLFFSVAYAIKSVADARTRRTLAAANGSHELIHSLLVSEEENRRMSGLRWGLVLTCIAAALAIIEWLGWEEPGAGMFALLVGATGLGNLAFFVVAQRYRVRVQPSSG